MKRDVSRLGRVSSALFAAAIGVVGLAGPQSALAYTISGPIGSQIMNIGDTYCRNWVSASGTNWDITESAGPAIRFPIGSNPPYRSARRWYLVQWSVDNVKWNPLVQNYQDSTLTLTSPYLSGAAPIFDFAAFSVPVTIPKGLYYFRAFDFYQLYLTASPSGAAAWQSSAWVAHDLYITILFDGVRGGILQFRGCKLSNQ